MKLRYLFLPLLAVACWAIATWEHGFAHGLGIDTQQSQFYDFVSGVGPMIVTVLIGAGAIVTLVRHINCHAPGCPRVGRYPLAGGEFKVCKHHHPDDIVRDGKNLLEHMHAAHRAHKARQ